MPPVLTNNQPLVRRLVVAGFLGVVFIIGVVVYSLQGSSYATPHSGFSNKPPLSNAYMLHNWLPSEVYSYTIARVDDYLSANQIVATSMTASAVATNAPTYDFDLTLEPQSQTLAIQVQVMNFNSILSTAVVINGQLQGTSLPDSSPNNPSSSSSITFSGIDALVNRGVTTDEANNLQTAFQRFNPTASTISINPASIEHQIDPNTGTSTYTFTVVVDSTSYNAKLICPDSSSVQLQLTDAQSKKQVFDSGKIDNAD